jgi:pSer/pThr/pTyr-binding forkhead associated (FHA) protein
MDGQKWILYVTDGSEQERVVPLSSGHALTIGRSDTSGLRLTTPSVSRNHALLEWHLDRPFLSDRGSTHGTRIGEEAVTTPRELRSGDTIHLADASPLLRGRSHLVEPGRCTGPRRHHAAVPTAQAQ